MSFHTAAYLRKATSRAKSDVANKLVSMFLHDVSRKICVVLEMNVSDPKYAEAVATKFGVNCCYCDRPLETDRASVEHLDGMNRFRVGLHIPGNVIVSCKKCNNEKRRDDQLHELVLAKSGWESFLSHDSIKCNEHCKTCVYWKSIWPDQVQRVQKLKEARYNITEFRSEYPKSIVWGDKAKAALREELDKVYRECQTFATDRIREAVELLFQAQ